ncbi:hypothetical protein [Paenibacillus oleatilyticus]|uniref:Uncharacterized protein n=1 Tax=Paenibacillus oleatilyticus TaxID=2594886 RepID=A0ABV4VCB2_9BACL
MPEFEVLGKFTVHVSKKVEAESAEEAVEKAVEEFGGITGYVRNGGIDKLLGVMGRDESIEANWLEIEWEQPEEAE